MGGSMVKGLLQGNIFAAEDITVADVSPQVLSEFEQAGVSVTTDNQQAATSDIVVVVVKPWLVQKVLQEIKPVLDYDRQVIIVIAAGVSSSNLTEWLGKGNKAILPQVFLYHELSTFVSLQCRNFCFLKETAHYGY